MLIGQPINRRDGRQKVTGAARYAAEFSPRGLVHAVLVQSTIAAGSVIGFDLDAAQGMPGVLAIITTENALKLPGLAKRPKGSHIVVAPLLQNGDVLYNGQHVAIAVADTLDRALAAAEAVKPRYRQSEALTDMASALNQAYPPKHFRDGARPPDSLRGDPDGAFAGAPVKLEATYSTPIEHHNPMEPHATVAAWEGDRLTVWTATQGISGAQNSMAMLFGIPPENVTILCPFVGGGFGCKGNTWPPATLAAMAARIVGRPVKLVLTRRQMYTSNGYRPRTIQKLRLAAEPGRQAAVDAARRDFPDLARGAGRVHRAGRALHRDAVFLPERRGQSPDRRGQCEPADLHARTGRSERQFRAGIGDGRARSGAANGPAGVSASQLRRAGRAREEAVRQQAAARLLRPRRRGVRVAAPHAAATLHA